jgi:peptide/nickel transport system substrate-binding protein
MTESQANTEVGFVMFNESKPPFDDEGARIALATATDREAYNRVVALGITETASGPFPPGAPGHLDDAGYPTYDPEAAAEMVAEYEQRTGNDFEFTYVHANDEESIRNAQFLQEMWEASGMVVNLQTREQAALINTALGQDWGAIGFRNFPGGVPDGNYVWWYTGSPVNFPRMSDPDVDRLLDEGRSELDPEAATAVYEELNRVLAERVHFGWLDWTLWTIATRPGVAGVMGPVLPDGAEPAPGLATGHSTAGLYAAG